MLQCKRNMIKTNIANLVLQPIEGSSDFNRNAADLSDILFDLKEPVDEDRLEKFWSSVEEDLINDPLW